MQKLFTLVVVSLIVSVCFISCATKKSEHHEPGSDEPGVWPEMESFHMVMAEAYHPYKDEKNLEPVKSLAENLSKEAEKWAAATLPEKVNTELVRTNLEKLRVDSRKLADLVKSGGSDEQIGTALSDLHTSFHTIMEFWQQGKEEGEEEHEHEKH